MLYSQERRKWVRKCLFKQCSLFEMSVSNKWSLFVSKSDQKTKTLTFCVVSCSTLSATSLHCHSNIPHCDSAAVSLNQRCVIFSSIKRQLMHSVRQVSYTISQSYHTFLIALILTQVFDKSCWSVQKKKKLVHVIYLLQLSIGKTLQCLNETVQISKLLEHWFLY